MQNKNQHGFTLIEAIVAIVIAGIATAMVGMFIRIPIQSYFDAAHRAEITDIADTALRRITRDLRLALPNSVRVTGNNLVIEFLQTRTGGRYRVDLGGTDDILDFTQADSSFEVLGSPITLVQGDQIVIYNLGIPGADAYEGNTAATHNRRAYSGTGTISTNIVPITSGNRFPFDSPGHHFQVVDTPVTYLCDLTAGTLRRYWGYAIVAGQPNPPTGGSNALLAQNVSDCTFTYDPGVTERSGLVSIRLSIKRSDETETISLYQEVHVQNAP